MFVPSDYPTDDEVVLRVRYTDSKGWEVLLVLIATCFAGMVVVYFLFLPRQQYGRAIICLAAAPVLLAIGFEALFTKHILFCRDRVVKVWYFFGRRSIPYRTARLECAKGLDSPRKGKVYVIKEVGSSGSIPVLQMPIYCRAYMVAPETDKQVAAVVSYLVGIETSSRVNEKRRVFQRTVLPKGIKGGQTLYFDVVPDARDHTV